MLPYTIICEEVPLSTLQLPKEDNSFIFIDDSNNIIYIIYIIDTKLILLLTSLNLHHIHIQ